MWLGFRRHRFAATQQISLWIPVYACCEPYQGVHTKRQHRPCRQKSSSRLLKNIFGEDVLGNDRGIHFELARHKIWARELHDIVWQYLFLFIRKAAV